MGLLPIVAGIAACLAAVMVLLFTVYRPASAEISRERRKRLTGGPVFTGPARPASLLTRFSGAAVGAAERTVGTNGRGLFRQEALQGAGLKLSPAEFLVLLAAGAVVAALLGIALNGPGLGLVLALMVPFAGGLVLTMLRDKRRTKFDLQLPDLIMTLAGSLRAGHSVMRAIDSAAQEFDAPMSEELARIVNEVRMGRNPEETMMETARRMDSDDFTWIAEAIQINREVGGDLSQVLDQVGDTIRERAQIKGQVRALSAEGKMSAYILIALPFGVGGILFMGNPDYLGTLFSHPLGLAMLGAGGVMLAIGSFWMSRMIKIKF
ncbi:MAG TPA: type II secretion system F family protein [Pseudolysinimonas sp.]|nr:type II secretion system F family protein [Pseudolysinimonas sp.]